MTKRILLLSVFLMVAGVAAAQDQQPPAQAAAGTVEAIEISGIEAGRLSQNLRDEMQSLVGQPYSAENAAQYADRIQMELPEYVAAARTLAGSQAGRLRVVFVVAKISEDDALGENINARYPVESVLLEGAERSQLTDALWNDMQKMVGQPLNDGEAERIRNAMVSELGSRYTVARNVRRGARDRQVTVVYVAAKSPMIRWPGPRSLFAYHTKQGITAFAMPFSFSMTNGEKTTNVSLPTNDPQGGTGQVRVRFGFGTNGDELVERYKGLRFQIEGYEFLSERLAFRVDLSTFGAKWKSQTRLAAPLSPEVPALYRSRYVVEPAVAFALTPDLFVSAGVNLTGLRLEAVAQTDSIRSAVGGIRYDRKFGDGSSSRQLMANYRVVAATRALNSDLVYTRHFFDSHFIVRRNKTFFKLAVTGGRIAGSAPLYDRFSIGNTLTARGWNKYDIAPLGATRMLHGTLEAGRSGVRLFYDAGSVWDRGQAIPVRHSLGLTFGAGDRTGEGFLTIAAAFRNSRLEPTVMLRFWGR
jgi:hypothetical protein